MTVLLILQDLVLLSGKSGSILLVGHQTCYHKMQVCTDMYGTKYGWIVNMDFGTVQYAAVGTSH